ncbi:MAG: putative lipoprotein, partial [Capsulimonas sp.]|nr:putative lipoprotein [Capsulimonas sp.]
MKNYWLLCILLALNGCGGGGGGGTSSGGSTVSQPVGDAASFEPAKVTVSYEAGSSKPIDIVATIKRPTDFAGAAAVYTLIKDSAGVISTEVSISALSSTSYKVVLNTSNTKAAGHYTGAFTIMFCRDTACASQFPGSPMALPFDITVATPPLHAAAAASLDLNMRAGDTAPVTVPVNITGVGLQWTATGSASWLTLSPASGTGPGTLTLSYNGTGLAPGQYTQTVRIATADGQSASLPVSMTV